MDWAPVVAILVALSVGFISLFFDGITDWYQVVAILVALPVVAIIMIPCFLFFRGWRLRVLPGIGAFVLATVAVDIGLVITPWILVGPGRPNLGDWLVFVVANAIIASVAGIPGALVGLKLGRLIERRKPSQNVVKQYAGAFAAEPVATARPRPNFMFPSHSAQRPVSSGGRPFDSP